MLAEALGESKLQAAVSTAVLLGNSPALLQVCCPAAPWPGKKMVGWEWVWRHLSRELLIVLSPGKLHDSGYTPNLGSLYGIIDVWLCGV